MAKNFGKIREELELARCSYELVVDQAARVGFIFDTLKEEGKSLGAA